MKIHWFILICSLLVSVSLCPMEKESKLDQLYHFLVLASVVLSPQTADFKSLHLCKQKKPTDGQQPDSIELQSLVPKNHQ